MDVVQRVHEEVWVNLILQILQLALYVLAFQNKHLLTVAVGLEVEFHTDIHAQQQNEEQAVHDAALGEQQRESRWHLVWLGTSGLLEGRALVVALLIGFLSYGWRHFVVYFHAWAEVRPATLFAMTAIAVEEHEHRNETSRRCQVESLSLLVDQ